MIRDYPYSGERLEKYKVVEEARLPYMAPVFYKKIFFDDLIPDEDLFFKSYVELFFNEYDDSNVQIKKEFQNGFSGKVLPTKGVRNRVLRTYPSLIRDFHFYLLCYESEFFDKVQYSLRTDVYDGIDLIVEKENFKFAVALFTNTKRAEEFKDKKYKRHNYENIEEIILTVDLKESQNRAGKFILYDDAHLNELSTRILTIIKQVNVSL